LSWRCPLCLSRLSTGWLTPGPLQVRLLWAEQMGMCLGRAADMRATTRQPYKGTKPKGNKMEKLASCSSLLSWCERWHCI
jgi:hypothetical protein